MERSGFDEFCRGHYTEVVRVAYLVTGDRQEALDVAQETFARAYERWGRVSTMENPVGWLMRVATNLSVSQRRRSNRRSRAVPPPQPVFETPGDPAVEAALMKLTPAQRAVVVLRFYLDLSIEETARTLGKRAGTVRALTSQGVARLREQLGESWLEVRDE
jgi:RNA polymerase sigma-70 factor (sigma-E family)